MVSGDGMRVPVTSGDSSVALVCQRYATDMEAKELHDPESASAYFLCIAYIGWMDDKHVGLILSPLRSHEGCMNGIGKISNLSKGWSDEGVDSIVKLVQREQNQFRLDDLQSQVSVQDLVASSRSVNLDTTLG